MTELTWRPSLAELKARGGNPPLSWSQPTKQYSYQCTAKMNREFTDACNLLGLKKSAEIRKMIGNWLKRHNRLAHKNSEHTKQATNTEQRDSGTDS